MQKSKQTAIKKLVLAAMCLALAMVLPLLTGQIPEIGSMLSPMHIPALLCGFICGPWWGLAVGFVSPLLRTMIFGMPPIAAALVMAFEMAVYGFTAGLFYRILPKKIPFLYVSLIGAMLAGRVVWGIVSWISAIAQKGSFTFGAFLAGAFLNAVPGIICHILLIPLIVIALRAARLMPDQK